MAEKNNGTNQRSNGERGQEPDLQPPGKGAETHAQESRSAEAAPDPGDSVEKPVHLSYNGLSTQTIDLNALFTKDITDSGSFDIRGDIWRTTFGRVLQALPIAAFLVAQDFSITVANEACKGISPDYERILSSSFHNLFPTDTGKSRAESAIEAIFADRRPRVIFGALDICGKRVWARATLRSIRIMTERYVLVLIENLTRETEQLVLNEKQRKVLQKEVSERKLSEEALKASEARFRQIYDKAPMMMLALSRDGTIRSANTKCLKGLGYAPEAFIGQSIDVILNEEGKAAFTPIFDSLWRTGEIHDISSQYLKKDRTQMEALTDGVVLEDPSWGPVSLLTVRDVTHEQFLEKQLREAQKMEALGTLAGGVAHDFNNLLQVIFGYAELLMLRLDKESPNYQGIRTIREAARRGSDLVKQVLTFSRRVESNPIALDLNHEVEKASRLLERTIPKMIAIDLNLEPGPNMIYADPIQVEQIILNLAVNAKDAMPDGGRLTLETRNIFLDESYCSKYPEVPTGAYACLRVADTGHGIETEDLEHIFEPFFSTKKPGEGTGLGLSTVFGLVKIHGGHITCESKRGQGTLFQICLPAIEGQVGWSTESTGEMPAFGTETVLLVDDEEFVRKWGTELLTLAGYTVIEATNGKEGVQTYQKLKNEISLVILDLIMPEMGGRQCLEELLKIEPNVKALIASGFPIDRKTKEFLEKRARAIITKPFHAKEFLRTVRRVLDRT